MTVHVDEMVTDVSVEPETSSRPASRPADDGEALARQRDRRIRLDEAAWRTAAEDYDD